MSLSHIFRLYFQSISKAYLKGIWDSVKGVSLIYIVIRDTYNHDKNQSKKGESETQESNSSSNTTTSTSKRANRPNRRELNQLKEYVPFIGSHFSADHFFFNKPKKTFFSSFWQRTKFVETNFSMLSSKWRAFWIQHYFI